MGVEYLGIDDITINLVKDEAKPRVIHTFINVVKTYYCLIISIHNSSLGGILDYYETPFI